MLSSLRTNYSLEAVSMNLQQLPLASTHQQNQVEARFAKLWNQMDERVMSFQEHFILADGGMEANVVSSQRSNPLIFGVRV